MERAQFPVESLQLIASAESFQCAQEPLIGVGSVVRLNSGGPRMLVVDIDADSVTASWQDHGTQERVFRRPCVHRCREI